MIIFGSCILTAMVSFFIAAIIYNKEIDNLIDGKFELEQTNNKLTDYVLFAQKENLLLPEDCENILPAPKSEDPIDKLLDDLEKKDLRIIKTTLEYCKNFTYLSEEVSFDANTFDLYFGKEGEPGNRIDVNSEQKEKIKRICQKAIISSTVKSLRMYNV